MPGGSVLCYGWIMKFKCKRIQMFWSTKNIKERKDTKLLISPGIIDPGTLFIIIDHSA